jgi:hypothetical protein
VAAPIPLLAPVTTALGLDMRPILSRGRAHPGAGPGPVVAWGAGHGTLRLMRASRWASLAAIPAALAWISSAVLGWGVEPEQYSYVAGLGLLVVSLAFGGYALVATAPLWLRAVVAAATPALGVTIWLSVQGIGPRYVTVMLAGLGVLAGGGIGLGRSAPRTRQEPDRPIRGRRAAR